MSFIRIDSAPVKQPIPSGTITGVWASWFSTVGDTLAGFWGRDNSSLETSGIVGDLNFKLVRSGRLIQVLITADAVETSGATITLPFQVEKTVLNLHYFSTGWSIETCEVDSQIITLPDFTADQLVITGTLLRKEV